MYRLLSDSPATPTSKWKLASETDSHKGMDGCSSKYEWQEMICFQEDLNKMYNEVLKTELFGSNASGYGSSTPKKSIRRSLFQYTTPTKIDTSKRDSPLSSTYSLSPLGMETQNILLSPRKVQRYISKVPCRVLDAPELQVLFKWKRREVQGAEPLY
jgi:hypothetical protein